MKPTHPHNCLMDECPLSSEELASLRRMSNLLSSLSDEELAAVANVGIGFVTMGRVRRALMYLMAFVGAVVTLWLSSWHLWDVWKGH